VQATTHPEINTPSEDELRSQLHGMWSSVAPGWAAHAAFVDERGAAMTERMLALTHPQPGDLVLELASGPGGVGLAVAPLVAPGEVVVSDVAAEMTEIAAERARALGLTNVTPRVLDLEQIDEPDASFDVVLCREGLMLVPDPLRAGREIRRVLRPGGRLAVTVWGSRTRNPWLAVVFDTVSEQLGAPVPPLGLPHPFSLDDADRLAALLDAAGLADVEVGEVATPYRAASVDEWWERTAALAGPLAQRLRSLPDAAARALRARARAAVSEYETPDGLVIPGVALVASATRA
jgi:ubiquinone/menaquinone biosynthesis C-methylase UbiE